MWYIIIIALFLGISYLTARALLLNDLFKKKKPSDYTQVLAGYDYRDIAFKNKQGKTLRGRFIKANTNHDNKTLVVLHERLGSRLTIIEQIKFFLDNGYHVFTYDQRSHGDSDSQVITYGLEEWDDLSCAIAYAKTLIDINPELLWAVGYNMGGCAMVCAPDHEQWPVFRAMVLEGIDAHAYEVANKMLNKKLWMVLWPVMGRLFFSIGCLLLTGWKFFHEKMMKSILWLHHTPKLLIQWTNDKLVTADNAQKIAKMAPNPVWVRKSEDAGHVDSFFINPEKYKNKVLSFLEEHMTKQDTEEDFH